MFEVDGAGEAPAAPPKQEAPKQQAPKQAATPAPAAAARSKAPPNKGPRQAAVPADGGEPPQAKPRIKAPQGRCGAKPKRKRRWGGKPKSQAVAKPAPRQAAVREWSKAQASPAVRARAQKFGIDLGQVRGTGPDGRITHEDLDKVLVPVAGARRTSALAEKNGIEPVKVIGLRRKIAEKMQDAKRRIPAFRLRRRSGSD